MPCRVSTLVGYVVLLGFEPKKILFSDNPVNEIKSWSYYIHNMANILMIILTADLSKTKFLNDKRGL